jgi:4a-hydroxytetrahydrobiopterin dehydratase
MRPLLLHDQELRNQLHQIPLWHSDGKSISKTFKANTFPEAITWVVAIATQAEVVDHHPDIDIRWTTLHISVTTHDQGGLTQLDIDLATAIDEICK